MISRYYTSYISSIQHRRSERSRSASRVIWRPTKFKVFCYSHSTFSGSAASSTSSLMRPRPEDSTKFMRLYSSFSLAAQVKSCTFVDLPKNGSSTCSKRKSSSLIFTYLTSDSIFSSITLFSALARSGSRARYSSK